MPYSELDSTLTLPWLLAQRSPHTRRAYERIIDIFCQDNKLRFLEQITPSDIAIFLSKTQSTGGQSKYNQARSALASFFDFQIRSGKISQNPVLSFKTKAVPLPISRFLPDEEIFARVVSLEKLKRNQLMLHFAFILGLRIDEILGTMVESLVEGMYGELCLCVRGKGGRYREIIVPEWLTVLVKEYIQQEELKGTDKLFHSPTNKGRSLTQSAAYEIFVEAGRRAGLKINLNPHKYRHGHAVTALENGASLKALKDSMGHSSLLALQRYVDQARLQSPSTFISQPPLLIENKS